MLQFLKYKLLIILTIIILPFFFNCLLQVLQTDRRLKGWAGGARAPPPQYLERGCSAPLPPKFLLLATYPTRKI